MLPQRNHFSIAHFIVIECFHMTPRRPYWCPTTMKRWPCWCPKPILWELNSFLMQTLSFVPINLHRCGPRDSKHSIGRKETKVDLILIQLFLLYYINHVVLMLTVLFKQNLHLKQRRFVSKEGQHKPPVHSKARTLRHQM